MLPADGPTALVVKGDPVPLPPARVVDGARAVCGAFATPENPTAEKVLAGRLTIATVARAKSDPRPWNVMSAPEPDSEETRLIGEHAGEKWVTLVSETWQTDPGPIAIEAKHTGRETFTVGPTAKEITSFAKAIWDRDGSLGLTVDRIAASDERIVLFSARPTKWVLAERPGGDAALALGVVAVLPDTTLVKVAFYSSLGDAEKAKDCTRLAEQLAARLAVGDRVLDLRAGERKLGPLRISVPARYVVTHKPGPDFDLYNVRPLRPLGLYAGHIVVALDDHLERPSGAQSVAGTLLGQPVSWVGDFAAEGGSLAARVPGRPAVTVALLATRDSAFLTELRKVAESLER